MNKQIHPELQKAGRALKLSFRANRTSLRFFHWATNRRPNAKLEGFQNDIHELPRPQNKGKLRVRVYRPEGQTEPLPVLLYFHGGGYAINSPEAAHNEIAVFLKACPCVVIAPNYTSFSHQPDYFGRHGG